MECLTEDQLRALLGGGGSSNDLSLAATHLEACAQCRGRLDSLAGTDAVLGMASTPSKTDDCPELRVVVDRLAAAEQPREESVLAEGICDTSFLTPLDEPGFIGAFAGYRIIERVAAGGMGVVFKAQDPALNRIVAIKVLAPSLAASASARQRFLREARAAAAVAHEHVVAIHAVGEDQGLPYLAMQFVKGRSLQARLANGPLELHEILRIGLQTAAGLAAAHAQGLVHRDIKPGNILLENSVERVKLTDFGLARSVDEPGVTQPGILAGTPEYMSPEQARGDKADARSDLFSFGSVLYAMATGRSPFVADSTPAVLRKVCDAAPKPAVELNQNCPPRLQQIIGRLLEKDPSRRIQTAHELERILGQFLADVQSEPMRQAAGRRMQGWPAALVALVIVAGLGAVLLWRTPPQQAQGYHLISGLERSARAYPDLTGALQAAASGDTIDIFLNGFLLLDPVVLGGKALTIRAGPGFQPILVNRSTESPLFASSAPLVLEGLELRAAKGDSDVVRTSTPGAHARALGRSGPKQQRGNHLIHMNGAPLFLAYCRLVGSSWAVTNEIPVFLENAPLGLARHSEFYHISGPAVRWRFSADNESTNLSGARLVLSNCVALASELIRLEDKSENQRHLFLNGNTVFAAFLIDPLGSPSVSVQVASNIFDVQRLSSSRGPYRTGADYEWRGGRNLYRNPLKTRVPMPTAREDRADLLARISAHETNSRIVPLVIGWKMLDRAGPTNLVRAKDFKLEIDRTGPRADFARETSQGIGAPVERLGPGQPYTDWRSTSDYEAWQNGRELGMR